MSPPDAAIEKWSDEHIRLSVEQPPDGFWCSLTLLAKVPLSPDAIFGILVDPQNHRVFRSIKAMRNRKVLSDDGHGRQEVEVEQVGRWRFGPFKGSFAVKLLVTQDKRKGQLSFRLATPTRGGFMRDFSGQWTVQPYDHDSVLELVEQPGRHWGPLHEAAKALHRFEGRLAGHPPRASLVQLRQCVQPACVPLPPLDRLLQKITAAQARYIMVDLLREAERRNELERRSGGSGAQQPQLLEAHVRPLGGAPPKS